MDLSSDESVIGEVTAIKPYGAFVRLVTGDQGMIHISEIATEYVRDVSQYLAVGQQVVVKVIGRNEEGKYNLSLKRVSRQDHDAALFHNEMAQFKKALDEKLTLKDEVIKRFTMRREQRLPQESLVAWLGSIKKELSELDKHWQRRMRFYEPDWQQLAETPSTSKAEEGGAERER